jgi:hypothetical protein
MPVHCRYGKVNVEFAGCEVLTEDLRGSAEAGAVLSLTPRLGQSLTPPVDMVHHHHDEKQEEQSSSWIMELCSTRFFEPCVKHASLKKNECNHFCSSCVSTHGPMCRHCLAEHRCTGVTKKHDHQNNIMFQIRMYMYKYVVHLEDLNKHFDASGVQAYYINQKKAVLLAPKEASGGSAGTPVFDNQCATCCVSLRPDCRFCSLICKATNADDVIIIPSTPMSSKKKRQQQQRLSRQSSQNSEWSIFQDASQDPCSSRSYGSLRRGSMLFGSRPAGRKRKLSTPMRSFLE